MKASPGIGAAILAFAMPLLHHAMTAMMLAGLRLAMTHVPVSVQRAAR
jgi:hypothetical protein